MIGPTDTTSGTDATGVFVAIRHDEVAAAVDLDTLIGELATPTKHLLDTRGQQLRGLLVQRAAMGGMRPTTPEVRNGAIAVELLHLGTLAHDDLVDGDARRRGVASVGAKYGQRSSAYVGLLLVAEAVRIVTHFGAYAAKRFAETVSAMCIGEMAEIEDLFRVDRTVARYRECITGKTAALFAFSAWLGAKLAGADRDTGAAVTRFGMALGMAFQIQDDVADLILPGGPGSAVRGKDLRDGTYTLPALYAMQADPGLAKQLGTRVNDHALGELVARIEKAGGIEKATTEIQRFARRARHAVADECVAPDAKEALLLMVEDALALSRTINAASGATSG
jgi:heptaprenyl diphosphate synthase